jgi:thiol-disulfide isomerase/thioredoxin
VTKSRRTKTASISILLALVLSACGTSENAAPETVKRTVSETTRILNVSGEKLDGNKFSFTSLASKPTVLWFWTPWCAICVGEGPTINEAYAQYGDEINIVGVGAQGSKAEMEEFVKITESSKITHINDFDSSVWAHFDIPLQPSLIFVGTNGYVDRKIGPTSEQDFQKRLEALLQSGT